MPATKTELNLLCDLTSLNLSQFCVQIQSVFKKKGYCVFYGVEERANVQYTVTKLKSNGATASNEDFNYNSESPLTDAK